MLRIKINNVITKSPLTEMVYEKSKDNLSQIIKIYEKLKIDQSEFFTLTLSENEITIICSDRIAMEIQKRLDTNNRTSDKEIPSSTKPVMMVTGLASISLTLDPKYYEMSNITYSLLRRIASKHIPLAETITTHTEIIFVFKQEYLSEMVMLFVK
mgnify:FL=1